MTKSEQWFALESEEWDWGFQQFSSMFCFANLREKTDFQQILYLLNLGGGFIGICIILLYTFMFLHSYVFKKYQRIDQCSRRSLETDIFKWLNHFDFNNLKKYYVGGGWLLRVLLKGLCSQSKQKVS